MIYDLIPSEVNTRDKKVMVTDSFALWSVTDPLAYLSRLGANKANAESRISVVVYNAVKNVISSTDQADVISGRDGKLAEMITEKIGSSLDSYGIKVKKVETKLLDLPDSNKEAVYQRMISERQNIAPDISQTVSTSPMSSRTAQIKRSLSSFPRRRPRRRRSGRKARQSI